MGFTDEEWIEEDRLPGPSADQVLLACSPGYWRVRADALPEESADAGNGSADFQRKIQPWIYTRPDAMLTEDFGTSGGNKRSDT